jgi:hypothetical protein
MIIFVLKYASKHILEVLPMSIETVTITRQFPIVNGYVQVPNNLERNKTYITVAAALAVSGTSIHKLDMESGGHKTAGLKHGVQEFIETTATRIVLDDGTVQSGAFDAVANALKAL